MKTLLRKSLPTAGRQRPAKQVQRTGPQCVTSAFAEKALKDQNIFN
jgi:hypothetical protein